ncbi:MAG: type III-B CRISPR-associated protein Cas10/Cmr2 [Bacteroidales bacterium]|jgi:CRISPR-associated protein Cmr2|nr:type III-B CRISPR-associated protein Cas10/Cmr2 [Bacteroidales bacterium]
MKYISLTLGPITRTINLAESTKELWAASYFFSYLAKKIVEPFAKGERKREFLMPFVSDERIWKPCSGAGLFPDRYIFKSQDDDFDFMTKHVESVLSKIAEYLANLLEPTPNASEVMKFLKSFLKIYFFEKSFAETSIETIVLKCERYMNLVEMQDSCPEKETGNYLQTLFENVNGNPKWDGNHKITSFEGSFLSKDAFGENYKNRLFSSIMEISAIEKGSDFLQEMITVEYEIEKKKEKIKKEKNKERNENLKAEHKTLEEENRQLLKQLAPYQKYIAIVKADGDDIGKAKKVLGKNGTEIINKAFLEFNIAVVDIINAYNGKPVFIGGDDILLFAPVYYDGKTIFDLINDIDTCFGQCFEGKLAKEKKPTLSFGVSITYHKFPMFEALENADYLLFGKAKNGELKNWLLSKGIEKDDLDFITKNNLAFTIQKHSGQAITAMLDKGNAKSYKLFFEIIKKYAKPDLQEDKEKEEKKNNFLSSVMHKLKGYESMLNYILKHEDSKLILQNFFENNFNEPVHEQYVGLLTDIQNLLLNLYGEINSKADVFNKRIETFEQLKEEKDNILVNPVAETINQVYAILRFIHFINSKNNE